nr:DCC1-like thiol-disulfide oxidoreductase family protein [uncultured Carboxylicivirga sp.]
MDKESAHTEVSITIFYDGWCNLCSGVVSLLLKTKKGKTFVYLPVQSANQYFKKIDLSDVFVDGNEIAVLINRKVITGATAVVLILDKLGGFYKVFAALLRILPNKFINASYRFIANNRYGWFGKKSTCPIG